MNQVLKAEEAVYGGYVIARSEGVVFIKGAVPGEVVEVSVRDRKRDYAVALVEDVVERSPYRVEPACRYFGECGGCQLQFVSYEMQLEMKNSVLRDCLRRIGGMEAEPEAPFAGADFNYRHRAQFKVSRGGRVGFYREASRDVVSIEECPLMTDGVNSALTKIRRMDLGGVREVHVSHGDSLISLIKGRGFDEGLAEDFINAGFSGVAFDDGSYRGEGWISLDLNGLVYTASPWGFLQGNWDLNRKVVSEVTERLHVGGGGRVLDMYSGGGNFSLHLASRASEVVAVEENEHSIRDGERNASINGINNIRFVRGSAEWAKIKGGFEAVVLDPPRAGLTKAALKRLLEINPENIAYVSCNPSTLARDLKKLSEAYVVGSVRMADMFPNTYHVESLAFLTRKNPPAA